jgi:hypothetical protein
MLILHCPAEITALLATLAVLPLCAIWAQMRWDASAPPLRPALETTTDYLLPPRLEDMI